MIGVSAQKRRTRNPQHKPPRPYIIGEEIVHRGEVVIRPKREAAPVEIIHGEPMPAAYLPVDPLVFAIRQRLESLEGDMALVHETIAAIGDAARETLLEADTDEVIDEGPRPHQGGRRLQR
jgi:hypothetical protein